VQTTPDLVQAAVEHLDRLCRAGQPTDPDASLVPNRRGGRLTRDRVGAIVADASAQATLQRLERAARAAAHQPPQPAAHLHLPRAARQRVRHQMGHEPSRHADSKMTLDVYAQLEQRIPRHHGINLDRLLHNARDQLDLPPADMAARDRRRSTVTKVEVGGGRERGPSALGGADRHDRRAVRSER